MYKKMILGFLVVWVDLITPQLLSGAIVPLADEVRTIYACHATYQLPIGGMMVAGKANNGRLNAAHAGVPLEGVLGWRPTLHFSLGSLCPDSTENTLSNRNHAIIVQLKDLEPQLIGLQSYDSFILGDFRIPDRASIIVPQAEIAAGLPYWVQQRNITVIPRSAQPLAEQVKDFIKAQNGWIFYGGDEKIPPKAIKTTPLIVVRKIDQEFFSHFLEQAPYVEYVSHCHHSLGFMDKNAHYFLTSPSLKIPGSEDIADIWAKLADKILEKLSYDEELQAWWVLKVQTLLDRCNEEKDNTAPGVIKGAYFEGEANPSANLASLVNYALTWIIKGKYILKGEAKGVDLSLYGQKTKQEAAAYLKSIGMMP